LENKEQYDHAKAHFAPLEGDVKHVDRRAVKGRLIDRKTLRILEPWLTDEANHLLGGVLYPACGTIHPRKVMLALALEARKDGVNIWEESEVTNIQRKDSESGAGAGWICTMGHVPDRLQEPVQGSDSSIHAKEVVIAAGAMTDYMVSLVGNDQEGSHQVYRILDETASAAVIPVVGQMFEVVPPSSSSTTSPKINHLIVGYESEMFWDSNFTAPPCVTHDHNSKERYCHHLYGKQTREGRFIFGGDRYVHPTMHPRLAHPLPRVLDKLFVGPYEHASRVLPCINDMSVTNKWGGIMPFSADGEPIIGELSFTDDEDKSKVSSGLYIISGLGGSGMMRGAMGGYLLAHFIAGDESEKAVAKHILDPVSPNRFWSR
jgi:glycine/D-amino acid oxidase-like deaminating enzyme